MINMKAGIDPQIFKQVSFDSGSVTMLASVVHGFSEPGIYLGAVRRGNGIVGRFSIEVKDTETSLQTPSQLGKRTAFLSATDAQASVDLKLLDVPADRHLENEVYKRYPIPKDGYAVFYVPSSPGGYSVELRKIRENSKPVIDFNSRILRKGDIFTAVVLRPGRYSVKNTQNKAEGKLTVAYPEKGKVPKEPQAVSIECAKQFTPNSIEIQPTQGLVFHVNAPSRIKIKLIEPSDKPGKITRKKGYRLTRVSPLFAQPEKDIASSLKKRPQAP